MSAPKTTPTDVSAERYIGAIANEEQRNDAQRLVVLLRRVTGEAPRMWGPSIVGFGSYHYKYDLGILNGRVMDPASGLDAVRTVGIAGGTIRAVSEQPLEGRDTLDARGMVRAATDADVLQR